ncbi:hypothetical protein BKA65DRAFT_489875 [Rhexocercosporidium sp. MPI-PUGE-AT-0058]|nr:hypothetical protein BKA65DRAFT_489875 [Rhexocercosporidium sp. MPI-PUGE-AT-0058]
MLPPYSYQLPGRYYKIAALLLNPPEQYNTAALDTYIDPCLDDDEKKERSQDEKAEKRAKRDQFKYLDVFRRKIRERVEDRYVDPIDGRLGILVVQATTAVYNSRNKTTWRRTYIENISPYFVRLAYWPTATIEKGLDEWNREQWFHAGLRWLPSCIGILILLYGPTDAEGQIRNNGYYDPFPYRLWSYPKVARNVRENQKYGQVNSITHLSNRITKPRMLCFLDAATDTNPNGVLHQRQWGSQDPTYIFVSYTGVGQFERRCNDFKKRPSCRCHRCLTSLADAEALHKIAKIAAEEAGVPAYWTDQCCMSEDPDEFSTDIYSISDVVRSSHSLVIILGESGGGRAKSIPQLLSEYGNRMWTFPEAILAPPKKDILVYRRGEENRPRRLARLDIAQRELGPDDLRVRELVDHYDGTVSLSRLEIVVIALECLLARDTSIFAEGDLTYALMGLLRQRPITDRTDSAFQAFARLSLANDSDKLLERIICLLPKDQARFNGQNRHYWAVLDDFWDAKLWDIDPNCQISAIGANDTVIIDGAYAATIHWESFHRVAITTKETWSRLLSRSMLRGVPGFVSMGALLYYLGQKDAGIAFLVLGGIIMLFSPFLVLHIYGGKVWSTQPWLFGFEGHMPIKEIETKVFGFPQNRLTWTPYGSSLSEHRPRQSFLNNECRGIDPMNVPGSTRVKRLVNDGLTAEYGESRAFTLVDTNTMTVTLFEAERPPAVALLCGSEGGMQRAVMCSYDWPTQTLYRETVLRMETRVLEKMSRVGRVRLGLRRNVKGKPETWPRSIDLTQAVEDNFGHSADV